MDTVYKPPTMVRGPCVTAVTVSPSATIVYSAAMDSTAASMPDVTRYAVNLPAYCGLVIVMVAGVFPLVLPKLVIGTVVKLVMPFTLFQLTSKMLY